MSNNVLNVGWYRLRATFARRWTGYLSLILLVGLIGGLGLGGLAAARRTQSSFTTYLASTNPSDMSVSVFTAIPTNRSGSSTFFKTLARMPQVRAVKFGMVLNGVPLESGDTPRLKTLGAIYPVASPDGLFFSQDRATVVQGRMANPQKPNQVMMSVAAAQILGVHVGQVIPYGFYTNAQENLAGFGTSRVRPKIRIEAKLVGLVDFNSQIVEDDIDRYPTLAIFTSALAREVLANPKVSFSGASLFDIRLAHGNRDVATVEHDITGLLPPGFNYSFHATAPVTAKADRALKPIAIALGVFGAVALLAALLIAVQAISRRIRESSVEAIVLRAIGANPSMVTADGLLGILTAVFLGSLLACFVALALSPIAPLGPVRSVYPSKGISADWTVLGLGLLILVAVLSAAAIALASWNAPHRVAGRAPRTLRSSSKIVGSVAAAGVPAAGVIGVRMALESGHGRTSVPVRSALVATSLAVALVVATVTFASSLQTLVNQPALYGWNWTYMLNQVGSGSGGVPPQSLTTLNHDPDVAAATGVNYNVGVLDGQEIPLIFGSLNASVTPPITSGHALEANNQIVLGAATMAQLHKRLGQTVRISYGIPKDAPAYIPPTRLSIVGTATMPAVGFASIVSDHTSMGTGALVSFNVLPPAFRKAISTPYRTLNGPGLIFVRMRPGLSAAAGRKNLQRIADAANKDLAAVPDGGGEGDHVVVQGVQRPAEIVDYKTIGYTPALLVSGLALGAITGLALTLAASVRRRRRDLALLKTIGFTQRQLASAVAWQASVSAIIGIVIGVPVGIILGRWLWDLFARQIYAVPHPTVPAWPVVLVAIGAFILANVVAAIPARMAARTPTALMLRSE